MDDFIIEDGILVKYVGEKIDVVIPDSVTSIGDNAFRFCRYLTSITIPNSVTSIGDRAFRSCRNLTSITIPDSVTGIGERAFEHCISLSDVYINSVESWCNILFDAANSNPFCYADNLYVNGSLVTDLVIPDSVISINDYAFSYCRNLTSITIPDLVTSIGNRAFSECEALSSINVALNNKNYCSIDGVLYNKDKTKIIEYPPKKCLETYLIPDSVTSIGEGAFGGCKALTSIIIPDSVMSIGDNAFRSCRNLTSVIIPNSVTSIGYFAFLGCIALTSITIPDSVTSIGDRAFSCCKNLTTIYGYIGSYAESFASENGYEFISLDSD